MKTVLSVDRSGNDIFMSVLHQGNENNYTISLGSASKSSSNSLMTFIFSWLMSNLKDTFSKMPSKLEIKCPAQHVDYFKGSLYLLQQIFKHTRDVINNYSSKAGVCADNSKILFWNLSDNDRGKAFFSQLENSTDAIYLNYNARYDSLHRKSGDGGIPMDIADFVAYLKDNEIGKVVTINYLISNKYVEKSYINITSLCDFLGVEWVVIDNDPPDLDFEGFLVRAYQHHNSIGFSNLSLLNKHWDEKHRLDIIYSALIQDYSSSCNESQLDEDYTVVIITNSRFERVQKVIPSIQFLLGKLPVESVLIDINTWYLATRYLLLYRLGLDEGEQYGYNCLLHNFYYNAVNYLKYYVVGNIKTDRPVQLYGDAAWQQLCPQYYKGLLSGAEIENLYKSSKYLFMLANCSMTYLDASGPVYDVVAKNVPWINVPAMAKTSSLEGMGSIEYSSIAQLNCLVNDYHAVKDGHVDSTLSYYRSVLDDSMNQIVSVLGGVDNQSGSLFQSELVAHQAAVDAKVQTYLENNQQLLKETTKAIFNISY